MKKALVLLLATATLALAVDVTLTVSLTPTEINRIRDAKRLSGNTNMTDVEYAQSICREALLKKADEVDRQQRDIIARNWRLLSVDQKDALVSAVIKAVTITNTPPSTNQP